MSVSTLISSLIPYKCLYYRLLLETIKYEYYYSVDLREVDARTIKIVYLFIYIYFCFRNQTMTVQRVVICLTLTYFIVQLVFSHITHSLTLLVDSYHVLCKLIFLLGSVLYTGEEVTIILIIIIVMSDWWFL